MNTCNGAYVRLWSAYNLCMLSIVKLARFTFIRFDSYYKDTNGVTSYVNNSAFPFKFTITIN